MHLRFFQNAGQVATVTAPVQAPVQAPVATSTTATVAQNNTNPLDDRLALLILAEWQKSFPDAMIFPTIGFPSKSGGVLTLTHSFGKNNMPKLRINGLVSQSPLANNALYSTEITGGQWLNLYEVMIPDVPGKNGSKSSGEIYTETIIQSGISVEGDHYHWKGANPPMLAIHSKSIGMHPIEFAQKVSQALNFVMARIH